MYNGKKYGHIKFEYEYYGDEYSTSPKKVTVEMSSDSTIDEVLENIEMFLKSVGYHLDPDQHIVVDIDENMS